MIPPRLLQNGTTHDAGHFPKIQVQVILTRRRIIYPISFKSRTNAYRAANKAIRTECLHADRPQWGPFLRLGNDLLSLNFDKRNRIDLITNDDVILKRAKAGDDVTVVPFLENLECVRGCRRAGCVDIDSVQMHLKTISDKVY